MYVAMTRAKNFLYISYPIYSDDEKELEPSRFISEVLSHENEVKKVEESEEVSIEYKTELMKYQQGEARLIDDELIDKVLENFKISATSLNKYLKCKLAFYFENILTTNNKRRTLAFGITLNLKRIVEDKDREKIYSKRVKAGKRTYFFDVRSTRSNDYYLTITESRRFPQGDGFAYEKHKDVSLQRRLR